MTSSSWPRLGSISTLLTFLLKILHGEARNTLERSHSNLRPRESYGEADFATRKFGVTEQLLRPLDSLPPDVFRKRNMLHQGKLLSNSFGRRAYVFCNIAYRMDSPIWASIILLIKSTLDMATPPADVTPCLQIYIPLGVKNGENEI